MLGTLLLVGAFGMQWVPCCCLNSLMSVRPWPLRPRFARPQPPCTHFHSLFIQQGGHPLHSSHYPPARRPPSTAAHTVFIFFTISCICNYIALACVIIVYATIYNATITKSLLVCLYILPTTAPRWCLVRLGSYRTHFAAPLFLVVCISC